MYYYGFFRSLDFSEDEKGQLFKVVIKTKNGDGVGEELIFTDSPFNIEYSTEDNDLFKPYKCSTATIGLLQKDMNFDFNTTSGNDVLVKLLKFDNEETEDDLTLEESDKTHFTVEWIGFATPNAYSQSYENYFDEFELECQDALSTLQYYKYETLGDKPTFVSFSDIIKKWCVFLGTYTKIYVTDTIVIPTTDFEDVFHTIYVDERNFFDEDGEPMTVLEVWEEICKYLSITCVPFKDTLYFVNYSAIKNGQNDYYEIKDVPPYDAEVEYLESTSPHNFMTTKYKPNQNTSIEVVYNVYNNHYHRAVFGCANSSSPTNANGGIQQILLNTGKGRIGFGNGSNTVVYFPDAYNQLNTEHKIFFDKNNCYIDGDLVKTFPTTAWQATYNLFLFARNTAGNTSYPLVGYIKSCKIWEGDELVRDYIPVRVGNVGYMYDRVSKGLKGNDGDGEFTFGEDVRYAHNYELQIGKKVKLEHIHDILPNDFAANGTSLTLLPTYNKVSVKDDFYPFDSIIPNLKDSENIVETEVLDTVGYSPEFTTEVVAATNDITKIHIDFNNKKHIAFIRYNGYENNDNDAKKLYTFWWDFDVSTQSVTANNTIGEERIFNYQTTCEHIGALPIQYQISEVEDFTDKINSLSLKDALMVTFPLGRISQIGGTYKQVLEWRSDNIALGKDNYIVISGNFTFFQVSAHLPYQMTDYDYYMDDDFSYQWASLRCGTYWWDGEQWINNPPREVRFKLPIKYEYGKKAYGQSIPIANNISYDMRLDKEGYAVPIPFENVEIKNVGFTLFSPNRIDNDEDNTFDPSVEIITDFDIQIATKNRLELIETKDNSNTEYVNVIPNGAVEEKEDTELKLTTWDFKSTNYSSLLYSENFYEDGFENALLNTFKRVRTIYNRGIGDIAFAEELIINNNVKQYSTPTTQLEVNLHSDLDFKPYSLLKYHFFDGKDFVVDGMSINVRENANTLKIVEKK